MGSSWNTSLVAEIHRAIALEARAGGADRGHSPEINVVTDPRFGRTENNYGGDPLLVTQMAVAAVQALQGGPEMPTEYLANPNTSVVAEAKHCCVWVGGRAEETSGSGQSVSPVPLFEVAAVPISILACLWGWGASCLWLWFDALGFSASLAVGAWDMLLKHWTPIWKCLLTQVRVRGGGRGRRGPVGKHAQRHLLQTVARFHPRGRAWHDDLPQRGERHADARERRHPHVAVP